MNHKWIRFFHVFFEKEGIDFMKILSPSLSCHISLLIFYMKWSWLQLWESHYLLLIQYSPYLWRLGAAIILWFRSYRYELTRVYLLSERFLIRTHQLVFNLKTWRNKKKNIIINICKSEIRSNVLSISTLVSNQKLLSKKKK